MALPTPASAFSSKTHHGLTPVVSSGSAGVGATVGSGVGVTGMGVAVRIGVGVAVGTGVGVGAGVGVAGFGVGQWLPHGMIVYAPYLRTLDGTGARSAVRL